MNTRDMLAKALRGMVAEFEGCYADGEPAMLAALLALAQHEAEKQLEPVPLGYLRSCHLHELKRGDDCIVAAIARTRGDLFTHAIYAADPAPLTEQNQIDAERYRTIRRGQHWSVIDGIGNTLRGDELDAAADAIRAKKEATR